MGEVILCFSRLKQLWFSNHVTVILIEASQELLNNFNLMGITTHMMGINEASKKALSDYKRYETFSFPTVVIQNLSRIRMAKIGNMKCFSERAMRSMIQAPGREFRWFGQNIQSFTLSENSFYVMRRHPDDSEELKLRIREHNGVVVTKPQDADWIILTTLLPNTPKDKTNFLLQMYKKYSGKLLRPKFENELKARNLRETDITCYIRPRLFGIKCYVALGDEEVGENELLVRSLDGQVVYEYSQADIVILPDNLEETDNRGMLNWRTSTCVLIKLRWLKLTKEEPAITNYKDYEYPSIPFPHPSKMETLENFRFFIKHKDLKFRMQARNYISFIKGIVDESENDAHIIVCQGVIDVKPRGNMITLVCLAALANNSSPLHECNWDHSPIMKSEEKISALKKQFVLVLDESQFHVCKSLIKEFGGSIIEDANHDQLFAATWICDKTVMREHQFDATFDAYKHGAAVFDVQYLVNIFTSTLIPVPVVNELYFGKQLSNSLSDEFENVHKNSIGYKQDLLETNIVSFSSSSPSHYDLTRDSEIFSEHVTRDYRLTAANFPVKFVENDLSVSTRLLHSLDRLKSFLINEINFLLEGHIHMKIECPAPCDNFSNITLIPPSNNQSVVLPGTGVVSTYARSSPTSHVLYGLINIKKGQEESLIQEQLLEAAKLFFSKFGFSTVEVSIQKEDKQVLVNKIHVFEVGKMEGSMLPFYVRGSGLDIFLKTPIMTTFLARHHVVLIENRIGIQETIIDGYQVIQVPEKIELLEMGAPIIVRRFKNEYFVWRRAGNEVFYRAEGKIDLKFIESVILDSDKDVVQLYLNV